MKTHPILFSTMMVQALLAGQKTQTRRLLNPQLIFDETKGIVHYQKSSGLGYGFSLKNTDWKKELIELCPFGKIGDVLWVRETWQNGGPRFFPQHKHIYKADQSDSLQDIIPWKPSIFMPKDACRLFLKITDIRVEKLGDISEEDAIAEGVERHPPNKFKNYLGKDYSLGIGLNYAAESYQTLWNSIHDEDAWETDKDKWVWKITFERTETP